jgi:ribonuclease J
VRALILTHGHEDHIGAVAFFLAEFDVPVYGTAFTLSLVERRLEEYDLEEEPRLHSRQAERHRRDRPVQNRVHPRHALDRQRVALAITTPLGVIIHTGDFKVDPTPTDNELFDLHTLADYGKRGVLLLLSDSTNADRPGYSESERAVRPRSKMFSTAPRAACSFPASARRFTAAADSRSLAGVRPQGGAGGRSMISVTEIAHSHGLLEIPDGILMRPQDVMDAPVEGDGADLGHAGRADVGALARGGGQSQAHFGGKGRHGGAQLAHHSGQREGHLPHDRPLSPRRRRAVRQHESAAARFRARQRGRAALVLNLVRPRYFVPIHGEYRQLAKHARLAEHLR